MIVQQKIYAGDYVVRHCQCFDYISKYNNMIEQFRKDLEEDFDVSQYDRERSKRFRKAWKEGKFVHQKVYDIYSKLIQDKKK